MEQGPQVRSSDLPVKMVTYLIVLALVVLIGIWWATQHKETPSTQPAPVTADNGDMALQAPSQPEQSSPAGVQPVQPGADADVNGAGTNGEQMGGDNGDNASGDNRSTDTNVPHETASTGSVSQPTMNSDNEGETVPGGTESPAPATSDTTPSTTTETTPRKHVPQAPVLSPDTPQSKIVLKYDADCWTDIKDAMGRQMLYKLEPGGRTVVLYGVAPFKVFLGYAPGVEITYNGVPFDHSPYHRHEIARFTLGTPEDNHPRNEAN